MEEIKTRPGDTIPTIEELLRQERVYIGREDVVSIGWVKEQSLKYAATGIERRKFYYEMPLGINMGRFPMLILFTSSGGCKHRHRLRAEPS